LSTKAETCPAVRSGLKMTEKTLPDPVRRVSGIRAPDFAARLDEAGTRDLKPDGAFLEGYDSPAGRRV